MKRGKPLRSHRNGINVPTREPIPYISPGRPEHIDDLVQSSAQVARRLAYRACEMALAVPPDGLSTPRRRSVSPASPAQRAKMLDGCRVHGLACGKPDPAHVIPRSLGGCNDPLCVVPLCRPLHTQYDAHAFDLLPYLTLQEQTHAVAHLGIARALRHISGFVLPVEMDGTVRY